RAHARSRRETPQAHWPARTTASDAAAPRESAAVLPGSFHPRANGARFPPRSSFPSSPPPALRSGAIGPTAQSPAERDRVRPARSVARRRSPYDSKETCVCAALDEALGVARGNLHTRLAEAAARGATHE